MKLLSTQIMQTSNKPRPKRTSTNVKYVGPKISNESIVSFNIAQEIITQLTAHLDAYTTCSILMDKSLKNHLFLKFAATTLSLNATREDIEPLLREAYDSDPFAVELQQKPLHWEANGLGREIYSITIHISVYGKR